MAYPIRTADVQAVLAPYLGQRFAAETPLCAHAAELLRRYTPGRTSLEELTSHVRDGIFGDLYEQLGQRMLLQLENGTILRIWMKDIDVLADEAVGVLMNVLEPGAVSLDSLRAHAMQKGSLAAMRLLLSRYAKQLSVPEKEMLQRIIRENDPLHRDA